MKITVVRPKELTFCSYNYLLTSSGNSRKTINTLIDAGGDKDIIEKLRKFGINESNPIQQVLLTHNHTDHINGLDFIIKKYNPYVYHLDEAPDPRYHLRDGQVIRAGDDYLMVIRVSEHSPDSVCFYNFEHRALFTGDTNIHFRTDKIEYSYKSYNDFLEKIMTLGVEKIYSGHNEPMLSGVRKILETTHRNLLKAMGK